MSLGDYNNNKFQNNGPNLPTVYSAYRMNNAESEVDKTCLTFTYWNSFLRVSISPKKETGNDSVQFDMKNGITINLSHTKARILADVLKKFKEDPEKYNNSGVPSGSALITISNGKEYNSKFPCIVIRKIDETGTIQSTYIYQMKGDYFFSVINFKEDGSYDRDMESYNTLELDQMITILESYYEAMTGATAYSVLHESRYENYHRANDLKAIADKLGVELRSATSSRNTYNSKSYFNNNSGGSSSSSSSTSYPTASIDDIY